MGNVLVINATIFENRVALVEDGTIAEYYVERKREKGIVGNIYKGRVVRVLPGMQAAFVDLGTDKAGFLYVNDISYDPSFSEEAFDLTEGEWGEEHLDEEDVEAIEAAYGRQAEGLDLDEAVARETASDEQAEVVPVQDSEGEGASEVAGVQSSLAQPQALESAASTVDAGEAEDRSSVPSEETVRVDDAGETKDESGSDARAEGDEAKPEVDAAEEDAGSGDTEGDTEGDDAGDDAAEEGSNDDEDDIDADEGEDEGEDDDDDVEDDEDDEDEDEEDEDDEGEEGEEDGEGEESLDDTSEEIASKETGESGAEGSAEGKPSSTEAASSRGDRGRRGRRRSKRRGTTHQRNDRVPEARKERSRRPAKRAEIQDLIKEGDEIVVQVAKAPIGSKGARITTHVSLPGRHLVFMPTVDHVGISRRIASDKERRRLRQIIEEIRPPGTGFIVRTVADGVDRDKLVADARFLLNLWADINKRKDRISAPALLHPDLDLLLRATRDLFGEEVERLVIDDETEYQRLLKFMEVHMPALKDKVEHYRGKEPIFDAYGIEDEMRRAQQRRVWLKSGGYLIIDQAEALTAIDVNSGRYIGKKNLEETITKINIEAAEEVVYQLRLRNMGGIIILDFIDMEKSSNREKVYRALEEALRKDKAKTNILKISELGLVEMTRKRVRESLTRMMNEPCPYCDGRGLMKTDVTVAYEVLRDTMREAAHRKEDTVFVNCSPEVVAMLTTVERDALRYTMERCGKKVVLKAQDGYHREQYDLYAKNTETGTAVALGQGDGKSKKQQQRSQTRTLAKQEGSEEAAAGPANGESRGEGGAAGTASASSRRRRRRRGRGRRDASRSENERSAGKDDGSAPETESSGSQGGPTSGQSEASDE